MAEAGNKACSADAQGGKVGMAALGGRTNATFRKISKTAGRRPRMISDAIRGDLMCGITQFVSQGCMSFASFRGIWQSRKLSVLHFSAPKRCDERAFLQQSFAVALDLLMKEEEGGEEEIEEEDVGAPVQDAGQRSADSDEDGDHSEDGVDDDVCEGERSRPKSPRRSKAVGGPRALRSGSGDGGGSGGDSSASCPPPAPATSSSAAPAVRLPTFPLHDIGPGSLPFQIGALYALYCLHGTQLSRPSPTPIRVSAAVMLALTRLRWRLKAAGPHALDALAVLARLVLGEFFSGAAGVGFRAGGDSGGGGNGGGGGAANSQSGSGLQAAAYTGPVSIAYVDSNVPETTVLMKWQAREREEKSKEVEDLMAAEARAARARMAEAGGVAREAAGAAASVTTAATSAWGPRARAEAAVGSVSESVKELSSTYREYAAALAAAGVSRATTDPSSSTTGDTGSGRGAPTGDRRESFGRDLATILDCSQRKQALPEAYGLRELALQPLAARDSPSPPPSHPCPHNSLPLPALPDLPPEFIGFRRGGGAAGGKSAKRLPRAAAGGERNRHVRGVEIKRPAPQPRVASGVRDNIRLLQTELNASESEESDSSSSSSSSSSQGARKTHKATKFGRGEDEGAEYVRMSDGASSAASREKSRGMSGARRRVDGDVGMSGLPAGLGNARSTVHSVATPTSKTSSSSSSSSPSSSDGEDNGNGSKVEQSAGVEGTPRDSTNQPRAREEGEEMEGGAVERAGRGRPRKHPMVEELDSSGSLGYGDGARFSSQVTHSKESGGGADDARTSPNTASSLTAAKGATAVPAQATTTMAAAVGKNRRKTSGKVIAAGATAGRGDRGRGRVAREGKVAGSASSSTAGGLEARRQAVVRKRTVEETDEDGHYEGEGEGEVGRDGSEDEFMAEAEFLSRFTDDLSNSVLAGVAAQAGDGEERPEVLAAVPKRGKKNSPFAKAKKATQTSTKPKAKTKKQTTAKTARTPTLATAATPTTPAKKKRQKQASGSFFVTRDKARATPPPPPPTRVPPGHHMTGASSVDVHIPVPAPAQASTPSPSGTAEFRLTASECEAPAAPSASPSPVSEATAVGRLVAHSAAGGAAVDEGFNDASSDSDDDDDNGAADAGVGQKRSATGSPAAADAGARNGTHASSPSRTSFAAAAAPGPSRRNGAEAASPTTETRGPDGIRGDGEEGGEGHVAQEMGDTSSDSDE